MKDTPQPEKLSAPYYSRAAINLVAIIATVILSTVLLQSLKHRGWTHYDLSKSGLAGPNGDIAISAIAIDSKGQLWAGGFDTIAMLDKNGTWKTYLLSESKFPRGSVHDLVIDKDDKVWVGTYSGLEVLSPSGTWEKILDGNVIGLAPDRQGKIWVGIRESSDQEKLSSFSHNQWTDYAPPEENSALPKYFGTDIIFVDQQGQVWTSSGIDFNILKPNGTWIRKFFHVSTDTELYPETLAIDSRDRVWMGASKGMGTLRLLYLCDAQCVAYNAGNSGLPYYAGGGVDDIALDGENRLWISTYDALVSLDISKTLPSFLIPLLMVLKDIIFFVAGYFYVAQQFPDKSISLIGGLGGGLFTFLVVDAGLIGGLIQKEFGSFGWTSAIIPTGISAVIGLAAGALSKKIWGPEVNAVAAYVFGGIAGPAIYFCGVYALLMTGQ